MRTWLALVTILLFTVSCSSKSTPQRPAAGTTAATVSPTAAAATPGQASWPNVSLNRVASGFTQITSVTGAGDGSGRLFVTEQPGRIRIIKNGTVLPAPFLDISSLVQLGSEQGLLSVAFSPSFATNHTFYINYTSKAGNGRTVVARYRVSSSNPDVADPTSGETVMTIDQPYANHNGGQLQFGPDGWLWVGMGDGGSEGDPQHRGQDPNSLLASMLRLDVEHGPGPYQPQLWSKGLRNPWRFSFDTNGDLYIGDVGQDKYEEVDFVPAGTGPGLNFGWSIMEGMHCYNAPTCNTNGLTLPVAEYDHSQGCSITGGYVYRGKKYASMTGIYFYSDYCSGKLWGMRRANGAWTTSLLKETGLSVSTFGVDDDKNLYIADYKGGALYEVVGQ